MDPLLQDILSEGMKALFLICLPCAGALAVVGLLTGILQTATSIHEQALSYTLKLVALFGMAALFFIPMRETLVNLCLHAFKG